MEAAVIVVGAGAAGLAALSHLQNAGIETLCVEARDRIGGRILTLHDPLSTVPVELGAEFIHGQPPEIGNIARQAALPIYEAASKALHLNKGKLEERGDGWDSVGLILRDMRQAAGRNPDISFEQFLSGACYSDDAKCSARGYVEGFNAAKSDQISIQALAEESKAAQLIDGDSSYRLSAGYDGVPRQLLHSVPRFEERLLLETVVERVTWEPGSVTLQVRDTQTGRVKFLRASRLIITVPLGVLQKERIAFQPTPAAILDAARRLCFGQVFRAVLRFREPFWENKSELKNAGFLFSQECVFPTWWTTLPVRSCNITGWSAGAKAEPLLGQTRASALARALDSLANITGFPIETLRENLQNAYLHDWHADPYALGAYSWVPAGALDARRVLAEPVADTLYFAGEATDQEGHSATVHGAIASGYRAAQQILSALMANG